MYVVTDEPYQGVSSEGYILCYLTYGYDYSTLTNIYIKRGRIIYRIDYITYNGNNIVTTILNFISITSNIYYNNYIYRYTNEVK